MTRSKMGRPCVFRGKKNGRKIDGVITKDGAKCFDAARDRLATIAGIPAAKLSDADVVEYLARGHWDTIEYLN